MYDRYHGGPTISGNTVVTAAHGDIYILERSGTENIIRLNRDGSVKYQEHIVDGYSAQALAITDFGKGYVIGFKSDQLYTFNLDNGKVTDSIDLAQYNSNSENPSPQALTIVGDQLYVGMTRFENGSFTPSVPVKIAVIDITTDQITETITCEGYNIAQFVADGTDLYVLNTGDSYGAKTNSTIEKINTADNTIETLTEALLDGSPITSLAHKSGNEFYATSYVGWGNIPVTLIDITSATAIGSKLNGVVSAFGGLVYDNTAEVVYIGEYDDNAFGILAYDEKASTMRKIETTLKPSSIALK